MNKGKLSKEIFSKYLENLEHGLIAYSLEKVIFLYQKLFDSEWSVHVYSDGDLHISKTICHDDYVLDFLSAALEGNVDLYYYDNFLEFVKDIDSWI